MKATFTLICICFIIGFTLHVQEVQAHKTVEIEDEAEVSAYATEETLSQQSDGASGGQERTLDEESVLKDFTMPQAGKQSIKEQLIAFFSHEPKWYWTHYSFELGCIGIFIISFIQLRVGKSENENIAQNFGKIAIPTLFNEFSHLGCTSSQKSHSIMQKSYAEFEYFSSGRKNVLFADFKINCIRRHCFLTRILDAYKGYNDHVVIEIPIDIGSREMPLEFLICKKRELKKRLEAQPHLKEFVGASNAKNYRPDVADNSIYMIMSEHDEIANQLIDSKVGAALQKLGASGMLSELHITDQKVYNNMPLMLRAILNLPTSDDKNEEFHQLLQMVIYMVDLAAGVRLSQTVHSKCEKARKKQKQLKEQKQREAQEEAKLEMKREAEKQQREKLKRMTPAEQAKYEEKQRKKEEQRMKSKFVKVMK